MKKIQLLLVLVLAGVFFAPVADAQVYVAPARAIAVTATLPATCSIGWVREKTGSSAGLYTCTAANTWTGPYATSSGGSGCVPAGSVTDILVDDGAGGCTATSVTIDGSSNIVALGSVTALGFIGNGGGVAGYLQLGQGTLHGAGANTVVVTAPTSVGTAYSIALPTGAGTGFPFFTNTANAIATTILADPLIVAHGGTGLATLTIHALYVGNTTSAPTALSVGATNTLLHGNTGADPSFSAVVSADLNITTTTCTNQFLTAINATGTGTCTTDTLASAQHANQGTTTTLLHGAVAGNPSFGAVVSADLNITTTTCTAPQALTAIGATALGTCTAPILTQNSQSAAYTTVLGDAGKMIYHPGADTTARTWTIDSNANVAYVVGTCITFVNDTSGGVITIAITSDTMILAGAGTTGSRTLAASGIATACKMTSVRWIVNGTGLS